MHFAFVVFVVCGFVLILIGLIANWSCVNNRYFRITHLLAVAIVVLQAWFGQICPLTLWESALRQKAGQVGYEQSFVAHWLHKLLFYEAEAWVFTTVYTVFAAFVVLVWVAGRLKRSNRTV